MKDFYILERFPKKELKSFIKVECPISTKYIKIIAKPNIKKTQEMKISVK